MLFVLDEKQNLQTLQVLTTPYADKIPVNTETLRFAYQKLLNSMQPKVPHANGAKPAYVSGGETVNKLIEAFGVSSLFDDTYYDIESESSQEHSQRILEWTRSSVNKLGDSFPQFVWMFDLVMDTIFQAYSKTVAGGTTNGAVGVLWVDPRETWSDIDMYEFLVHELAHTLLYLHEWRYGLFTSLIRLSEKPTYAMSAIRSQMRPMDKAFHSAVVATDVLLLRELILGHKGQRELHPETEDLVPMVLRSIESIREVNNRENMLTEYALSLLEQCHEKVTKIA